LSAFVGLKEASNSDYITSNSEINRLIIKTDYGRYYNDILSLQNLALMTPDVIVKILDEGGDIGAMDGDTKAGCKNVIIAKTYTNEGDLVSDNNNTNVYFDAKHDTTNYAILENYENEITQMTSADFMQFLTAKLKNGFKLTDTAAAYMAETLINGRKRIIDGQYAILTSASGNAPIQYYIRKANHWSKTASPPFNNIQSTDSTMLCNTQDKCISNQSMLQNKSDKSLVQNCSPIEATRAEQRKLLIKQITSEFDNKFVKSIDALRATLEKTVKYNQTILPIVHNIEMTDFLKYNNQKLAFVAHETAKHANDDATADTEISPYARGFQLVLNEPDFTTRQYNLIKFANHFTRKAYTHLEVGPRGEKETEHWLYCIKTNSKLMPTFMYILATVFIETPDKYAEQIDLLIAKIGKLSDDGNMWVDMYSGYPIKTISSSVEEGFDDAGHRIVTRGIVEKTAADEIESIIDASGTGTGTGTPSTTAISAFNTKIMPTDSLAIKHIKTIITFLVNSMGITLDATQYEFIASTVIPVFETNLPDEAAYNKTIKTMATKGKTIPPFETVYNGMIMYLTLATYFIAVQTSIPPVHTRKTFPTCVRSFSGYPFDGEGDQSGLQYLACVLVKTKNVSAPWNVLAKKEKNIVDNIITHMNKYILALPEVKLRMDLKTQYLETHQSMDIMTPGAILYEYSVNEKWLHFLPPLNRFKLSPHPEPITSQFRSTLLMDLKTASAGESFGKNPATTKVNVLRAKVIQFSLAIQESIQSVIDETDVLLHKSTNEPFLENACCINPIRNKDQSQIQTAAEFFVSKKPNIVQFNKLVTDYQTILYDIRRYGEAPQIWCPINDKIIYAPLPTRQSEKTIYNAFITFCNFRNYNPVPPELHAFCPSKPDNIHINDTLNEMIVKLKADGRNYTYDDFLKFMQVVNKSHSITIHIQKTGAGAIMTPLQDFMVQLATIEEQISQYADADADADADIIRESVYQKKQLIALLKEVLMQKLTEEQRAHIGEETGIGIPTSTSKLNNFLLDQNKHMQAQIVDFLNGAVQNKRRQVADFMSRFMKWREDDVVAGMDGAESGETTVGAENVTNKAEIINSFVRNIAKIFPAIVKNKATHMTIPVHWELADNHVHKLQEMLEKFYAPLQNNAINGDNLGNIFNTISKIEDPILSLCEKTRYIFNGERTGNYLCEYYILRIFLDYIDLSHVPSMLINTKPKAIVNISEIVGEDMATQYEESDMVREQMMSQGTMKLLQANVGALILAFMDIYINQQATINLSPRDIKELVYSTQKAELAAVTSRLKMMTIAERATENKLKQLKLGEIWGLGLQKGLVEYDAKMYSTKKQQDFIDTMMNAEMQARINLASMNGVPDGVDYDNEDMQEEVRAQTRDEQLDNEAYNENLLPGDDADEYGDDNDYGNNDGESFDRDE
jgi:hypothetical protein